MHCVVDWISNLPVSVAVLLALAGGGAVSTIGLFGINRILPHPIRSAHNDVSGFILAIVGVIYAVLLAFIAVAAGFRAGRQPRTDRSESGGIRVTSLASNATRIPLVANSASKTASNALNSWRRMTTYSYQCVRDEQIKGHSRFPRIPADLPRIPDNGAVQSFSALPLSGPAPVGHSTWQPS
jgi:hypothetical protein